MTLHEYYENPLCGRYADEEMKRLFSDDWKFSTWRKLWVALAESEQALGLPITDEQLEELRAHIFDIDYEAAARHEHEVRHDVMAHVLTYGEACPKARGIIHLGATSCYVGDNTDILRMREGLRLIRRLLLDAVAALADFAEKNAALPTLAYTHFQAAQPTTVGKRACLWIGDLLFDLDQLDFQLSQLKLLGCKGTTGTAASFLALFDGDAEKAERLEAMIAEKMGFSACQAVSGQTYTRKADFAVLQVLSGIAQSASKFATDIRLLSHLKEIDEPFESHQIGSSAMAYKRNPMRSERICSLSRYLICDVQNTAVTAATQWLERTLDDSANRRISIPEAFLCADAVLNLVINVARGMKVYPAVVENEKGGDRQSLHEAIRQHSVAAAAEVKQFGRENDLLERIAADPLFSLSREELDKIADPAAFTGLAERQCRRFLEETVKPLLEKNKNELGAKAEINV